MRPTLREVTTSTTPEVPAEVTDAFVMHRPMLRGWSHLAAGIAAVAIYPTLIVFSPGIRLPVALFGAAVIGLFGVSGLYHCFFWGTRAHGAFQRLDHAMIFIVIAATYTPIALRGLSGSAQTAVLSLVWTGALIGAFTQLAMPRLPRSITVSLYIIVGWAIAPVVHQVWGSLGVAGFILLLTGGLLHTLGAVVYAVERPNPFPRWFGFHEIFHGLVIAAMASHYVVIAFII